MNFIFFTVIAIITIVIIIGARRAIHKHRSTLIKGLILYPFVMVLDIGLGLSIFIAINTNKALSLANDLISIFEYTSMFAIMLITLVLIVSHAVDKSSKIFSPKWIKPIIFIISLFLPFFFLPNITKKTLTTQDIAIPTLLFMICSLILSYLFADTFSRFKDSSFHLVGKFKISKEWIGFLGTIIGAIISLIGTIITKK